MKQNVVEVSEEAFQQQVIEQSHQTLVLVDFWAPWCGPCRMLTPVLEALAEEGGGAWILAKVNSDENQALAREYGVRGIPNVKAFRNGTVVDEFVGAQPKPVVQRFLQKWVPSRADEQVSGAEALLAVGNLEPARSLLNEVLKQQPDHLRALLTLARLHLAEGQPEAALALLDEIPANGANGVAARWLRAQARFAPAPQPQGSVPSMTDSADTLDGTFELARAAAWQGNYDAAARTLLHLIERQRAGRGGAAHQALLDLFVLMGEDDPRTTRYRQALGMLLFT